MTPTQDVEFTQRYAQLSSIAVDALPRYVSEVRAGQFPDADHTCGMKPEEEAALAKMLAERKRFEHDLCPATQPRVRSR